MIMITEEKKKNTFPPIQQEYGQKPNTKGYDTHRSIMVQEFWQKQGWGGQSQLLAVNRMQPSRGVSVMMVESLAHGLLPRPNSTRRVWAGSNLGAVLWGRSWGEGSGEGQVLCFSLYTEGKQDEEQWGMTDDQISRQRLKSPRAFAVAHCLKGWGLQLDLVSQILPIAHL